MKITTIPIEEAVGLPLAHDLTQIDADRKFKGARFRRGQILRTEDLPILRQMGRLNLSVMELEEGEVHEDEAARSLAEALCGEGLEVEGPEEGRCRLVSKTRGLVRFVPGCVERINRDREWAFGTCPANSIVNPGTLVASLRILPLVLERTALEKALQEAMVFSVNPFLSLNVALVTTGSEIKAGLVRDVFCERLLRKLEELGGSFTGQRLCGDGTDEIQQSIRELLAEGADIVICTGGMSVDADDRTPHAIRSVAESVLFRGVPAMPGANLMLARSGGKWIVGAPACVVHDDRTTLDRLLIALFAGLGEDLNVANWGIGGLCLDCHECIFPDCAFARLP